MTAILAEVVRELAAAMGQPYEVEVDDTGLTGGEWFVDGELVLTSTPCWVVKLGPYKAAFVDHIGAMFYLRVLGVRDET